MTKGVSLDLGFLHSLVIRIYSSVIFADSGNYAALALPIGRLGARAVFAEAAGGYARELTPEEQQIQRDALSVQMGKSDVIVTTALVPGRPAPKLVSAEAVAQMKPGSVIVDLAGEAGGNCELARPGETYTTDGGVVIATPLNLPSQMAEHASALYARNVLSLLELGFDFDDEVVAGACVVRDGKVVER